MVKLMKKNREWVELAIVLTAMTVLVIYSR